MIAQAALWRCTSRWGNPPLAPRWAHDVAAVPPNAHGALQVIHDEQRAYVMGDAIWTAKTEVVENDDAVGVEDCQLRMQLSCPLRSSDLRLFDTTPMRGSRAAPETSGVAPTTTQRSDAFGSAGHTGTQHGMACMDFNTYNNLGSVSPFISARTVLTATLLAVKL